MKEFLLLMSVIFVSFQFIGHSQTALEVVWEKPEPIGGVLFARISPDGKSIYCASKNLGAHDIVLMSFCRKP